MSRATGGAAEDGAGPGIRVHIVVPVYNNRATLRRVVEGLTHHGLPLVVVDDGSSDGSPELVDGLPLTLLRHPENRGKGAALLTAAGHIRDAGGTHMICFDADGQFDPGDVSRFVRAIAEEPRSIVYGERQFVAGEVPGSSVFGRSFSNFWTRVTTGRRVTDSQCGFRAYPVDILLELGISSRRYDFEVDAMVRGVWAGLKPVAVPVSVSYAPPEGRVSHFRPVVDNARISRSYSRLFFRALAPLPHCFIQRDAATGRDHLVKPWRPLDFMKSMLRESSTPQGLAASTAVGLFLATLPLIGFHTVAVVFTAGLLRLNRLLAFSVSHLAAPPFVPAVCLEVGHFLRHGRWLSTFNAETLWRQLDQRLIDYLLGTLLVAPALAAVGAVVTFCFASVARSVIRRSAAAEADPPGRTVTAKYGTSMGIGLFRLAMRLVGLRGAYLLLWLVVPYYILVRRSVRLRTSHYLRRRFPDAGPVRRLWLAFKWVEEFSCSMIDEAAARINGPGFFQVDVPDMAGLRPILTGDRGVILLLTHAGGWRVAVPTLDVTQKPANLLLFNDPSEPTATGRDGSAVLGGARVIDPTGPFGGLIEATAALSRGEIVCIMGDRWWGGRTTAVEFLGDRAVIPESPYRLARSTDADLVMILVSRAGYRQLRVDYHVLWSETVAEAERAQGSVVPLAQSYMDRVASFLEEHPFAWSNFFDFWKLPAKSEGGGR